MGLKEIFFVKSISSFLDRMPEDVRLKFIGSLFVAVISVLVVLSELPMLAAGQTNLFLIYKGIPTLGYIFMVWVIYKWPKYKYTNYWFVFVATLYSIGSSYFRPLYVIAIFDTLVVFIFLFAMTKKEFWILTTGGLGLYTISILSRYPDIPDTTIPPLFEDHFLISLQRYLILILTYHFFIKARDYQLNAEKRFSLVGRHAARVAHDLKGMLAAPVLLMESVKQADSGNSQSKEVKENIEMISRQINKIHDSLLELSRLCSLDQLPKTKFDLRDAVDGVKNLYLKRIDNVNINIKGDLNFYCDRSFLTSILSNLLSNSLNQFKLRQILNPKIDISVIVNDSVCIVFEDNGGGYSSEALTMVNSNIPYSISGTGIGTQLVRDCVAKLDGRVVFENGLLGARVMIQFDKQNPAIVN